MEVIRLQVTPNPNEGVFTFFYIIERGDTKYRIVIYNIIGSKIYEYRGFGFSGLHQKDVSLNLSSGVYIAVLYQKNKRVSTKFVVIK